MSKPLTDMHWKFTPIWMFSEGESWVRLFRAGTLYYDGEKLEVDEEELQLIARETNRMIANFERYASETGDDRTPWKPPIMAEHESEGGKTYGKVLQLKVKSGELFGRVGWKKDTWEQVLSEDVEFVSPHLRSNYQDSKGETYDRVLWETSLTTHPRLKDIGRVQDTISVQLSDNVTITLNEDEGEDVEDLVKEMMARLEALEAKLDQALEMMDGEDDGEMGDGEGIEAGEGEGGEGAADPAPAIEASEANSTVVDLLTKLVDRQGKIEQVLAEIGKGKSANGLLTGEPGGDGGADTNPVTLSERIAELKKEEGLTQVQASLKARAELG